MAKPPNVGFRFPPSAFVLRHSNPCAPYRGGVYPQMNREKKFAFRRQTWHSIGDVRLRIRSEPLPPTHGRRLGGT